MNSITFNIPYTCKESSDNVSHLIENPQTVNNNVYLNRCKDWFEASYPGYTAFMTTSCTRAMELISLTLKIAEGDEIILSPYTYVGVGNAFSNYGAKLVFVDIDAKTMNIDAGLIEAAITPKTRAIIAMHYASIPCDMVKIASLCDKYNLILIEDNAQGVQASYLNRPLGGFGDFSCISFDMLKNISCNEGGVLLCKKEWIDAADVAYNNGTNKMAFSKGLVDKYEWVDKGSKFAMSEYAAAVLHPLLERSAVIIAERKKIWKALMDKISGVESLKRFIPDVLLENEHNAHLAYLKFDDAGQRDKVLRYLNLNGVPCSFHYVPLDNSVAGRINARSETVCPNSLRESNCLLRLPMHNFLSEEQQYAIVSALKSAIGSRDDG